MAERSGPKSIEVNEEMLEKVKEYGRLGHTNKDMARLFNISESVWYEKKKKYPEIQEKINEGKLSLVNIMVNILVEKALEGDTHTIRYLLDKYKWAMDESSEGNVQLPSGVQFTKRED